MHFTAWRNSRLVCIFNSFYARSNACQLTTVGFLCKFPYAECKLCPPRYLPILAKGHKHCSDSSFAVRSPCFDLVDFVCFILRQDCRLSGYFDGAHFDVTKLLGIFIICSCIVDERTIVVGGADAADAVVAIIGVVAVDIVVVVNGHAITVAVQRFCFRRCLAVFIQIQ